MAEQTQSGSPAARGRIRDRRHRIGWPLVAGVATVVALLAVQLAPESTSGHPTSIEGSWLISRPAAVALRMVVATFHADGTVVMDAQPSHPVNPSQEGVTRHYQTAGHGTWTQGGEHEFFATVVFVEHDQDGAFIFTFTVHWHITYDPASDTWTSQDRAELRNTGGELVLARAIPGENQATRIRVER